MNGTDKFFDEMLLAAKARARREIGNETKSIKAENARLKKRNTQLEKDLLAHKKAVAQGQKDLAKQADDLIKREQQCNLAIKEIQSLCKQVDDVQKMSMKKFVHESRNNWGHLSQKASALKAIKKAKT